MLMDRRKNRKSFWESQKASKAQLLHSVHTAEFPTVFVPGNQHGSVHSLLPCPAFPKALAPLGVSTSDWGSLHSVTLQQQELLYPRTKCDNKVTSALSGSSLALKSPIFRCCVCWQWPVTSPECTEFLYISRLLKSLNFFLYILNKTKGKK